MSRYIPLCSMFPGDKAVVRRLNTSGSMRRRFLDIGIVNDTVIECIGKSPLGDPSAYFIRGAVIAIRAKDAESIDVELIDIIKEKSYGIN